MKLLFVSGLNILPERGFFKGEIAPARDLRRSCRKNLAAAD